MSRIYSPSFIADGPLVFVSGQVPAAPDGSVAEGDAVEQARQVFRNIGAVLDSHGADFSHVVKVNYYIRRLSDLADLRNVMGEFLREPRPASTLVEVSGLIDPRFLMEIDAIATLPRGAADGPDA
ncbi:enamine deaminase RidA (YjgF/YER057c/UK114 family) [Murinocardiopsis flavida]|uniref:Enamine deaminase RidA (YjgF/YER057c/UK114 family) n=1 Tax=Murinocardiopsis flavida TaxID=645275 RepID=A0A2P8DEP4_9ACTN|nr:RidA family protein [Murinocardiopsis flavida]PSK95658.1 enamine deaminase RidA (YjgF/YER057c/UK114 family) [Murinocardiopsis flavida]